MNQQRLLIELTPDELSNMIDEAFEALKLYFNDTHYDKLQKRETIKFVDLVEMAKNIKTPTWIKSWSKGSTDENQWLNFGFILNYFDIKPNQDLCPHTTSWLKKTGPWLVAGLSYLPPGQKIEPHIDNPPNDRSTTYHLGLTGDEDCILKVSGSDTLNNTFVNYHHALPGKWTHFEDSDLHSAENNGTSHRIILYLKR